METIGTQEIWSFFNGSEKVKPIRNINAVRKGSGHRVNSFIDLATKVAELQFRNRDYVLLFRGQSRDYRDDENKSTLKPSLFRPENGRIPNLPKLMSRYDKLGQAERLLVNHYKQAELLGFERLERHKILRWSILQHYEVCGTPLIDVTHSLRIAASFASIGAQGDSFLFVLGIPNLSGAITASAEAGLQIVRLSSVCPPTALRPHLQEGYLLGEYPEMSGIDQKALYNHREVDFGHRMVAKFIFNPNEFWNRDDFPKVSETALYPSAESDPLFKLALRVKQAIYPT